MVTNKLKQKISKLLKKIKKKKSIKIKNIA